MNLAALAALLLAALPPQDSGEQVLLPGFVNDTELLQLHDDYANLEAQLVELRAAYDEVTQHLDTRHWEAGFAARGSVLEAIERSDELVDEFRTSFEQAYLYEWIDDDGEPTDPPPPVDPPVDPPDPGVYGPREGAKLVRWDWKPVDGAGKKGIPELIDKWLPGTTLSGFVTSVDAKGDSGGGVRSENFNGYDDDMSCLDYEQYWYNKWATRQYGTRSNVEFGYFYVHDGVQEHVHYHNMVGWAGLIPDVYSEEDRLNSKALWIHNGTARNIPGQFAQIVMRPSSPYETQNPAEDFAPGAWIVLEDLYLERVGIWDESERASFALSFFAGCNPVRVSRVTLNNTSLADHSRGALLVQGDLAGYCERDAFVMEDCDFDVGHLYQPFAKFEGFLNGDEFPVTVTGTSFDAMGGQNRLDFENWDGPITIADCTGNATIRIFNDPTPYTDKYDIEILFEGPVSEGVIWNQ